MIDHPKTAEMPTHHWHAPIHATRGAWHSSWKLVTRGTFHQRICGCTHGKDHWEDEG